MRFVALLNSMRYDPLKIYDFGLLKNRPSAPLGGMNPPGKICCEHFLGIFCLQLDAEKSVSMLIYRKLEELPELGLSHPGAYDLTFHGFIFRRRQAMAAEYVRIDPH